MVEHPHPPPEIVAIPPQQSSLPPTQPDTTHIPSSQPVADGAVTTIPTFTVANPLNPTPDELLFLASNPKAMAAYREILQSIKASSP